MSLQFLRNLNKNVQESLSIINEGFHLASGLQELKSVHLPYLLTLDHRAIVSAANESSCCLYNHLRDKFGGGAVGGNVSAPLRQQDVVASPGSTASALGHLQAASRTSSGASTPGVKLASPKIIADVPAACPLGSACMLAKVNSTQFTASISFAIQFLENVAKINQTQSMASRILQQKQSVGVLVQMQALVHVIDVMRNIDISNHLPDRETLLQDLINLVVFALKLLDAMLVYPNVDVVDPGKVEQRKLDLLLKESCNSFDINDLELIGSVNIVTLDPGEKSYLDHYQYIIDECFNVPARGGAIDLFDALKIGDEIGNRDLVYYSLVLLIKVLGYTSFGWHLYRINPCANLNLHKLFGNFVNWQLVHNGECFRCQLKMCLVGMDAISRDVCTCPVKPKAHPCAEALEAALVNGKIVSRITSLLNESGIVAQILPILLLLLSQDANYSVVESSSFLSLREFVLASGMDLVCNALANFHADQFCIVDATIDSLGNDVGGSLKNDVKMASSVSPACVDAILILINCLARASLANVELDKVIECLTTYCKSMLRLLVFLILIKDGNLTDEYCNVCLLLLDACKWLFLDIDEERMGGCMYQITSESRPSRSELLLFKVLNTGILDVNIMTLLLLLHSRAAFESASSARVLNGIFTFITRALHATGAAENVLFILSQKLQVPLKNVNIGFGSLVNILANTRSSRDASLGGSLDMDLSLLQHLVSLATGEYACDLFPPNVLVILLSSLDKCIGADTYSSDVAVSTTTKSVCVTTRNVVLKQLANVTSATSWDQVSKLENRLGLVHALMITCDVGGSYSAHLQSLSLIQVLGDVALHLGLVAMHTVICMLAKDKKDIKEYNKNPIQVPAVELCQRLQNLFRHPEHVAAVGLLSEFSDLLDPCDGLLMETNEAMTQYWRRISTCTVLTSLQISLWYNSNYYKFKMTPMVHAAVYWFRLLLYGHAMNLLISKSASNQGSARGTCAPSMHEQVVEGLKRLHQEQLAFASLKISQLETQMHALGNAYYLAQEQIRKLKGNESATAKPNKS